MKLREIAALRLSNQRIAGGRLDEAVDVVSWLGAVQSQEFPYAMWSLGKRMSTPAQALVDAAFTRGDILRTHALRPTWHFLPAADLRWIQKLTAPRVHAFNATVMRAHEVDDLLPQCRAIIEHALAGGNHLTRRELQAELAKHGIEAAGQKLAYIVMNAELEAVICSGRMKGKQHTYALVDERAPNGNSLTGDEALVELTRRYFQSHGPATARDYAWWSSFTMAQSRRAIEMLGGETEQLSVDGRTYWHIQSDAVEAEPSPTAHLMQGYDEYIVAYTESRDVLWAGTALTPIPATRPPFTHALMVDGQLAGHWRRIADAKRLVVEVQLHRVLKAREKGALREAVERYRAFTDAAGAELRGM